MRKIKDTDIIKVTLKIGNYCPEMTGKIDLGHLTEYINALIVEAFGKAPSRKHKKPKYTELVGKIIKTLNYKDSIEDEPGTSYFRRTEITEIYILRKIVLSPKDKVSYHIENIYIDPTCPYGPTRLFETEISEEGFEKLLNKSF